MKQSRLENPLKMGGVFLFFSEPLHVTCLYTNASVNKIQIQQLASFGKNAADFITATDCQAVGKTYILC